MQCSVGGYDIEQTVEERDLGELIDNQLHSSTAVGKARSLLGLITLIVPSLVI